LYYKEPSEVRKQLFKLITGLEEVGATNIITSELPEKGETLGKFGVEEFISDGVIKMEFIGLGGSSSFNIQVRKMRRTNHLKESFPYDITGDGIKISKL
jgi:circadian clock protein KaiC